MKVKQLFAACGLAAALGLGAGTLSAQNTPPPPPPDGGTPPGAPKQADASRQGRGNFDPAQMQQRILDATKERLGFSDTDWSAVQPLVTKVLDATREVMASRGLPVRAGA